MDMHVQSFFDQATFTVTYLVVDPATKACAVTGANSEPLPNRMMGSLVHSIGSRRSPSQPKSDQLQEPTFARSGVGAHGAAAEVLLQHDVAPLSDDDPSVIICLAAIRPALISCSSGIVS